MVHRHSALKSLKQSKKRYLANLKVKEKIKNAIKIFKNLLKEKKIAEAKNQLDRIYSLLDKAAKKKIIHPNKASRKKSRFTKLLLKTTQEKQKSL
ncbi:MAG: 30S ribosomal protein S20 [Candidatus Omnitrophica bacterium]|nr:30S ribosomal protein S20 [Candidatus Omnitrophota bacterium]